MFRGLLPKGSLRQVVANNTVSQLIGRAVSSVSIVVVSLLIAKRYGPIGYGDFVKITTYVGFFYLFADYGLNAVYIKRSVDGTPSRISDEWRTLFGLRLILSAILVCIAVGLMFVLPFGSNQGYTSLVRFGIYLLTPVILFQAMTTTTNAYFQKILRYDFATVAQNAGSLAMVGLALLLAATTSLGGPILGVTAVFCGSVVTGIVALFLVRSRISSILPSGTLKSFRSYFFTATPLGLALIFNLIYFHSDSVILTLTRATREVGIYGLAYKVFELPLVVPIFFMNAVYPLMLKSSGQQSDAWSLFKRSFQFLLISSLLVGVVVWVSAPLMVYIRPDFADSIAPLRILLLGLPVFFISALYMWYLIAQGRQKVLLFIHGGAMVGNILCNIIFIPQYGYIAASWITIISEFFVLLASVLVVNKEQLFRKGGRV